MSACKNWGMMNAKIQMLSAAILAVGASAGIQFRSEQRLEGELAALRSQVEGRGHKPGDRVGGGGLGQESTATAAGSQADLEGRLLELEKAVGELSQAADQLRDRGQLPLTPDRLESLYSRFADPGAKDEDRLRALGLLRRNRALTDQVVNQAIDWLQTASDPRVKRELLKQLDGATNAALKAPLLGVASQQDDARLRREAVENLRSFADDPQVESLLWQRLSSDPEEKVREEAAKALRKGPLTDARANGLRERALNSDAPLEERVTALRGLHDRGVAAPEVTAALGDLAQNTQDPIERAKLFRAFEGVNSPELKVPLVYGLQDANPVVRQEAAGALKDFSSDPAVEQWRRSVAGNDADPKVRREAFKALENQKLQTRHK